MAALKRELGPQDNLKIDEYEEAVRDVERRIQLAEAQIDTELPHFDAPEGAPASYEEHMELMFDLQLLGFQADLTRVSSFICARIHWCVVFNCKFSSKYYLFRNDLK